MAKYAVFINAPPYPMRGYYLEARRLSIREAKGEQDFRDTLPPNLVHICGAAWVEVEATTNEEAKAVGLEKIVKCEAT